MLLVGVFHVPERMKTVFASQRTAPVVPWVIFALAILLLARPCRGQDIEPRRWSHLPIGANFAGAAYAYTTGDIGLQPELQVKNVEFNLQTVAIKYIRSFELLGKSARV